MLNRAMVIPGAALAVTAAVIAFGFAGGGGHPASSQAPETPTAVLPLPTDAATLTGATGVLRYRSGDEIVSADMAGPDQVSREAAQPLPSLESGAGYERIDPQCDIGCTLALTYTDGGTESYRYGAIGWSEWNAEGTARGMIVVSEDGRE